MHHACCFGNEVINGTVGRRPRKIQTDALDDTVILQEQLCILETRMHLSGGKSRMLPVDLQYAFVDGESHQKRKDWSNISFTGNGTPQTFHFVAELLPML